MIVLCYYFLVHLYPHIIMATDTLRNLWICQTYLQPHRLSHHLSSSPTLLVVYKTVAKASALAWHTRSKVNLVKTRLCSTMGMNISQVWWCWLPVKSIFLILVKSRAPLTSLLLKWSQVCDYNHNIAFTTLDSHWAENPFQNLPSTS